MFGEQTRSHEVNPSLVGAFDAKCELRKVVEDAAANAQFLCEKYYLGAPEIEIEMVNGKFCIFCASLKAVVMARKND